MRAAAGDPHEAAALACALIRRLDPSSPWPAAAGSPDTEASVRAWVDLLADLPAAARLPLIDTMAPALRRLSEPERQALADTLHALAGADGQTTTFEYALQAILAPILASGAPIPPLRGRMFALNALAFEASAVLSRLAHLDRDPATAFARGAAALSSARADLRLLDAKACDLEHFGPALLRLRTLGPVLRRHLLVAALAVLNADGHIAIEEAELYRAIAATLDLPVPLPVRDGAPEA